LMKLSPAMAGYYLGWDCHKMVMGLILQAQINSGKTISTSIFGISSAFSRASVGSARPLLEFGMSI